MIPRSDKGGIETARLTRRRALLLFGGQLGVTGVIGWRLWVLQVRNSDEYRDLADNNRIDFRLLAPVRGAVYDRNGILLAGNESHYRVLLTREKTHDVAQTLDRIDRLVPLSDAQRAQALSAIDTVAPFMPVVVAEDLSWDQISAIAANAPALPGIDTEVGQRRIYPFASQFSHLLGYVGPASTADRERERQSVEIQKLPQFAVGKIGVERGLDAALRGRAGHVKIEVNAEGRVMRELSRRGATAGNDVQLSIDQRLQSYALERMKGLVASAVVVDVRSGELLCVASLPSFNPNAFIGGISHNAYRALLDDQRTPLWHRAVQGVYPPASTFKMITALAALEAGVITPDRVITCRGSIEVAGRRFHCWKHGGHGTISLRRALAESCDTYFYRAAEETGIKRLARMAETFGLGQAHALPLPDIAAGLVPDRQWKERTHGTGWQPGDTLNVGIGQGFALASPLQLALMTARIATGTHIAPRLLAAHQDPRAATPPPLAIPASHLEIVRAGMVDVVNGPTGTARNARIDRSDFIMAGKTGTAQVRTITDRERSRGLRDNDEIEWRLRDHALFCAYAPLDAPRLAAAVVVEHGGSGSAMAAPIARDILLFARRADQPPDKSISETGVPA